MCFFTCGGAGKTAGFGGRICVLAGNMPGASVPPAPSLLGYEVAPEGIRKRVNTLSLSMPLFVTSYLMPTRCRVIQLSLQSKLTGYIRGGPLRLSSTGVAN